MTAYEKTELLEIARRMRQDVIIKVLVKQINSIPPYLKAKHHTFLSLEKHIHSKYPMFFIIISKYK